MHQGGKKERGREGTRQTVKQPTDGLVLYGQTGKKRGKERATHSSSSSSAWGREGGRLDMQAIVCCLWAGARGTKKGPATAIFFVVVAFPMFTIIVLPRISSKDFCPNKKNSAWYSIQNARGNHI